MKKKVAILGSTGSIGTQALDVIAANPDHFSVELLTSNSKAHLLVEQAIRFQPATVVIADKNQYAFVKESLASHPIKVFAGEESLSQVMELDGADIVLTAVVGFAGLKPTLAAIRSGKQIALANKETLVVAGELVTALAK